MRFNPNTPTLQIIRGDQLVDTRRPLHQMVTKILLDSAARLGYTGKKLPAAGLPAIDIQGVQVWVDPLPEAKVNERTGRTYRPFTLRVQSQCPQCGWRGGIWQVPSTHLQVVLPDLQRSVEETLALLFYYYVRCC